jgi:uncharacterized protein (PEP-CTERM system associated)
MARLRLRLTPLAAALTLAGALHPALAADVKFTPRVELRETYTDNVHLATIGLEQPDVVTELKPGFALELNGRRLKGHADYTLDYLRYRDRKTDKDKLHSFFGEVGLEAVDDWLFVEAKGNVGQVLIDPFGTYAIGENAINLSANRAEIRSYSVTPYVRHDIGDFARGEVRYAHESVSSDADRMSNTQTDRKTLVLSSGPAFHNVGWGLLLNDETIDFASVGKVGITTALGVLKYNVSRQFALTSTLGHEKYGYLAVDNRSSGAFWTVGFGWRPSVRTLLDFSVGHRFYGTTASLNFNHSSRRTAWQVSYNEDITTTQQQFAVGARNTTLNTAAFIDRLWTTLIPDVNARQAAVLAFIRESGLPATLTAGANSFANTFFLQKALQASVAIRGRGSNMLMLNAFNSLKRSTGSVDLDVALFGAGGTLDDRREMRQAGIQALWLYALSPRTTLTLSGSHVDARSASARQEIVVHNQRIALSHRITKDVRAEVELRRMQQSATVWASNIRERAASVALIAQF